MAGALSGGWTIAGGQMKGLILTLCASRLPDAL